jgi:hypothetical protein
MEVRKNIVRGKVGLENPMSSVDVVLKEVQYE